MEIAALVEATDPMTYDITPADLDMALQKPAPSARELWESEGDSLRTVGLRFGRNSDSAMRRIARRYGFERNPTRADDLVNTWAAGPCLKCQRVVPAEEITEDWLCIPCGDGVRKGPYHVHRWGSRPDPGHRDWLALEKIAHWYRMRDEARRRVLKRPITIPPDEYDRLQDTRTQR